MIADIDIESVSNLIELTEKRIMFVKIHLPKVYSTRLVDMVKNDL